MKHVLVVDDDPTMRDVVGSYLENNNFRVSFAADGQAMNRVLTNQPVDLMILDLKLTDEDGLELMQDMGAQTDVPIIVLTGHRRDETDRVVGLELGADDYMMKPVGLRELLARVRAVLRRAQAGERRARTTEKRLRYRYQQVLSREQLLAASRVHDEEVLDRSVDIRILRLRRKLERNPSEPQLIRTERGVGYVFALPVEIL